MRDAFIAALAEATASDPSIILMTGDLGFNVLDNFEAAHPNSYLNVGVAEQNMAMLATGCALSGRTVFTYSIANFPTLRCLEMLRNDVTYHDAAVVTVAVGGGYSYGPLGMSHHATEDLAILRAIPGMTVVAPSDTFEVVGATHALIEAGRPAYLRIDKSQSTHEPTAGERFELGKARRLRDGDDLTVISCGGVTGQVLAAVDHLANLGMAIGALSMHTVKPIDSEAIQLAATTTGGIVTVEEHVSTGGLGSAVLEVLGDAEIWPRRFHRCALDPNTWAGVGTQDHLRSLAGLDQHSLAKEFERVLQTTSAP
ncbi:MAG: transketolase [Acidimicrobiia bacterium]|nr:transketolase [Acidimicrobiia bacterium]